MVDMKKLGVIITMFVFLIIAINLLTTTADSTVAAGTIGSETEKSITIASSTAQMDPIGFRVLGTTFFGNRTVNDSTITATTTTRVNISSAGVIVVNASVYQDGPYNVTYTYAPTSYVQGSGASRTLIGLIPLFFVFAVLAIAIGGAFKMGILDDFIGK